MLECTSSEKNNINRECTSLFITHTHTHSLGCMSERGEALSVRERETEAMEIIFMFSSFTAAIGSHSISEEVLGFSHLWFP